MTPKTKASHPIIDSSLLRDAADRAVAYLHAIGSRSTVPSLAALEEVDALSTVLPESPSPPEGVLELLDRTGSPATLATAGGRYFGFVIGGALPAALAANWMASAWGQNAALRIMSPAAASFEAIALTWARDIFGLPEECGGAVVTGATMANFTGLCAARHRILEELGWDVECDGLFAAPPLNVVVGEEVHPSVLKALGMLGLGRKRVHRVPVDNQGRLRADSLPKLDSRTIICIQAGNVNTGAFDPAEEICRRARDCGAWVHVDGAFGLWAAASPSFRHLTRGFEMADSWATDGHKWPNAGYDCGLVFARDAQALWSAMSISAAYLPAGNRREPSHFTPELSRRARGIELWAALRSLGRSGLADLIERTCTHARRFAEGLRASRFEILNDVVINQVLVSFGEPAFTRVVIARIQRDGICWCGETEWQGRTAMRISVSSWVTTSEDVELSLDAICRAAKACGADLTCPPETARK